MGTLHETQLVKGSFTLICGRTGSGKTTFLKQLKENFGSQAGYVMQNPDNQIVCDKVLAELSYGLTNMDLTKGQILARIAETASYFGISRWLERDTDTLSGGEKQILNLAAVMAMNPEYLILDEPTSMLDPIMATRFLEIILRIHRELGTTIIIAEHRPDELFGAADTVVWIEKGEIIEEGAPLEVAKKILTDPVLGKLLPVATQICSEIPSIDEIPITIADGRAYIFRHPNLLKEEINLAKKAEQGEAGKKAGKAETEKTEKKGKADEGRNRKDDNKNTKKAEEESKDSKDEILVDCRDVVFSYEKRGRLILNHFDMQIYRGEVVSILGENGSGKTTAALLLAQQLKPYAGSIHNHAGHTAMLFQDVTVHFTKDSYQGRHPYDYSGGEQQLLALSLVLEKNPDFLILDEPTKGLDAYEKEKLADRIGEFQKQGKTILLITHDVAFAAEVSDRMALLFHGSIATFKEPETFCRENLFYTTPKCRLLGDRI